MADYSGIPDITVTGSPWESNPYLDPRFGGNSDLNGGNTFNAGGQNDTEINPVNGNIARTPEEIADSSTFFGLLKNRANEVMNTVKNPEDAAKLVMKEFGIVQDKNGTWGWNPFTSIGAVASMTGIGAIGKLSGLNQFFDFLGLPHFRIEVWNDNKVSEVSQYNLDPAMPDPNNIPGIDVNGSKPPDSPGSFDPNSPNFSYGNENNYDVVPFVGGDGKIEEIVVSGRQDGKKVILTPEDFKKYGIDPENLGNTDWDKIFGAGEDAANPDKVDNTKSKKPLDPDVVSIDPNDPFNNNQSIGPNGPPDLGGTFQTGPGDGANPPGSGPQPTPETPAVTPPPQSPPNDPFTFFKNPEFKFLSNSFGETMVSLGPSGASSGQRRDIAKPPQE